MEKRKFRHKVDDWEEIGNAAIDNPGKFLVLIVYKWARNLLEKIIGYRR